jgi:predicted nucleic acid-binding protein
VSRFFDTNILVYAFLDIEKKRGPALDVLAEGGVVSVQVLNEFVNVAHKQYRRSWTEIEAALAVIREHFPGVVPIAVTTHEAALVLSRDHHLSFYDALIVAAAIEAGCEILFSEDMQNGRAFGELKVRNPFI